MISEPGKFLNFLFNGPALRPEAGDSPNRKRASKTGDVPGTNARDCIVESPTNH